MENEHMREYVPWAERQASQNVGGSAYIAKQVLTDEGGKFVNDEV